MVAGGVLNAYKLVGGVPDTSLTIESIHLDKLIGVHATEAVFDVPGFSFQVLSTEKTKVAKSS